MEAMRLISEVEAAAYLGVSPLVLRTWATRKSGPSGRRLPDRRGIFYRRADLDAFLSAWRGAPAATVTPIALAVRRALGR
jgi:hypothetical protein